MKSVAAGVVSGLVVLVALVGCSDDAPPASADGDGGGSAPAPSVDRIDAAAIAACPRSTTTLTTADWITCLAGRSVAGKEPFGGATCELRVGQGGAFAFVRDGVVALSVPARANWGASAFGTYQNGNDSFIAGLSPDLPVVEGSPSLQNVRLFFAARGVEDSIEVDYLDARLARATYACRVDVL